MLSAMTRDRSRPRRWPVREWLIFAAFVAPNLFLFAVFSYWPLIQNGYLSFVEWDFISPEKIWVGLDNWQRLLGDPQFRTIATTTFVFTTVSVSSLLGLGLALALLLNQPLRGRDGARTALFAPTILSGSAIAIVWIFMFDPNWGIIRVLLDAVGIQSPRWLTDIHWALPAVIIVYVWKSLGYTVVIFLAGLQSIPKELHDAARVDGAGPWQRFRAVTLPGLGPIAFFLLVTNILASFQSFDIIKVMTGGGPVIATTTLIYQMYVEGFVAYHAGYSAVYALLLFFLMLGVTTFQLRFVQRRVAYS